MSYDLAIKGGKIVTPWETFEADIAIKSGVIAAIGALKSVRAAEVINAQGLHVLPGIIDSHVHLRFPGDPDKEDFATGTRAAAAGGITTILEMPNSVPTVHSAEIVAQRARLCAPHAYVDFALYGAGGTDSLPNIQGMANAGVIGFKTFLHAPPEGRESEFVGVCCTDEASLFDLFKAISRTGLPSAVHVESNSICDALTKQLIRAGRVSPVAHAESRPEVAEISSAASTLAIAEETGVRLQLAHMSTDRAVKMAHDYRKRGVPISVETCPHYLAADVTDLDRVGPFARINPPLRSPETVEALWACLSAGMIDMIGSDHAPYQLADKEQGRDNIFRALCGSPGLETMLPVMLNAVSSGRLSIEKLVLLMSHNPARVFGLYPAKGAIRVGSDADLTLVDLKVRRTVQKDKMQTKAKDTAVLYDGKSLTGWPVGTVVRGHVVMKDGQIFGKPGHGRFIAPANTSR